MIKHPSLPGTVPGLSLNVSHARKLLSQGQTGNAGNPTSNSEIGAFINFMQDSVLPWKEQCPQGTPSESKSPTLDSLINTPPMVG